MEAWETLPPIPPPPPLPQLGAAAASENVPVDHRARQFHNFDTVTRATNFDPMPPGIRAAPNLSNAPQPATPAASVLFPSKQQLLRDSPQPRPGHTDITSSLLYLFPPTPPPPPASPAPRLVQRGKREGNGRRKRQSETVFLGLRMAAGTRWRVPGPARNTLRFERKERNAINDAWPERGKGVLARGPTSTDTTFFISSLPSSSSSSSSSSFPSTATRRHRYPNTGASSKKNVGEKEGGRERKSERFIHGVFNASLSLPRRLIPTPRPGADERRREKPQRKAGDAPLHPLIPFARHTSKLGWFPPDVIPFALLTQRQIKKREASLWEEYRRHSDAGLGRSSGNVSHWKAKPTTNPDNDEEEEEENLSSPTSGAVKLAEDPRNALEVHAPTNTLLPSSSPTYSPHSFSSLPPSSISSIVHLDREENPVTSRSSSVKSPEHSQKGTPNRGREQRDVDASFHDLTNYIDNDDEGVDDDDDGGYEECVYFTPPSFSISSEQSGADPTAAAEGGGMIEEEQHVVETLLTVLVKDINDNAPAFPNTTIYGKVEENGVANLSVAVVAAWDADDASEGTNARLTYSIEKNVIDERSGEAIFAVHPETGLVRTALCCLDRETTPEYHIQVVATDGGGQKGTGTVVIRLSDVNDNSPRLTRKQWDLTVQETWGDQEPENTTLLEIAAADRDTANYFHYRVVKESGWGWEHFQVRTVGAVGQLYPIRTLDYEDEMHREGFRFMVQVTDQGRQGWTDPLHLDTAWISVRLTDVNDNPPVFVRPHAHVTVREDAAPGTLLASLPAHDPDMAGQQKVDYWVEGGWGALKVDGEGSVTLWRALDREAPRGAEGMALVVAVDQGLPPLTATATLSLTVTDVNDCAPTLLPPTVFHVAEDAPPTMLGVLKATDEDVWAMGHGPPFNFSLAPTNPAHVLASVLLKFDPQLDSGRGGAELWTVGGLDREAWAALEVIVSVGDAGGLWASHTVIVVVNDLNDHPMKPAAKTVYLWKTQGGGSEAPLGRVYVDDPDDWDADDKSYEWDGPAHPLFSLHPRHGTIFAASVVREGSYALRFKVSDRAWGQQGVPANVTVVVRDLSPDALTHATPITLTPTTPEHLTRAWTPTGGGGVLGTLLEEVLKALGNTRGSHKVQVVSVYGSSSPYHTQHSPLSTSTQQRHKHHHYNNYYYYDKGVEKGRKDGTEEGDKEEDAGFPPPLPFTCVWLSVVGPEGVFLNPTRLQGILGLHVKQLEEVTKLRVDLESPKEAGRRLKDAETTLSDRQPGDPSSAASLASTTLPLQVVDTNATSLVTPRLTRPLPCRAHEPETCTPSSCLNGGRCLPTSAGNRCVCPGGSEGWQCKVLARTFLGSGWAWVPPPPRCLPTTASLRLLTRHPHALLLYAGPMAPTHRPKDTAPTPMLALQLKYGRPQLLVEGGLEPMKVEVNATLTDGEWHSLHFRLDEQGVALMVDHCGHGWENPNQTYAHCLGRAAWANPWGWGAWPGSGPLQVGGMAHTPPTVDEHRWAETPLPHPLRGCLSHLTLNGQLVDLGQPAHSGGSTPGCRSQEAACSGGMGGCGLRGKCVNGLNHPECECHPGWVGVGCSTPSSATTLGRGSYMRVALSFTPPPTSLRLQMRLRTWGGASGALLHVAAQHRAAAFTLHLRSGIVCASLTGAGVGLREACVEGRSVGDGAWHTVFGERHGENLLVGVDDGDGWRRNESLASLQEWNGRGRGRNDGSGDALSPFPPPVSILVDKHEGVTVGGLPKLLGGKVVGVTEDLADVCIDDVRVSGRQLPLPPAANGTSWGQVTTARHLTQGCVAPDPCTNTTCAPPLTCSAASAWDQPTCSCGSGRRLAGRRCEDVDECLWGPCLHGGTCTNLNPGYICLCGPTHAGDHCQWNTHAHAPSPLTLPAALAVSLVAVSVIIALVVSLRLRRQRGNLCGRSRSGKDATEGTGTLMEMKAGRRRGGRGVDDPGGGGKRRRVGGGSKEKPPKKDNAHDNFIVRLRLKFSGQGSSWREAQTERNSSGSSRRESGSHRGGASPPPVTPVMVTPDLARDDLRAYAYEGDESSSGSLTSAIAELKVITAREEGEVGGGGGGGGGGGSRPSSIQLIPGFLEVVDLLKNLPESSSGSSSFSQSSGRVPEGPRSPSVPPPPPPPSVDASVLVASSVVSLQPGEGKAKTRIGKMSPARRQKGQEAVEKEVSTVC